MPSNWLQTAAAGERRLLAKFVKPGGDSWTRPASGGGKEKRARVPKWNTPVRFWKPRAREPKPLARLAHSQSGRLVRAHFQRGDFWNGRGSGTTAVGTGPAARGATPADGPPALAQAAPEHETRSGTREGVRSRALLTTPRICSNHQWARLERSRPRLDGRIPAWFPKLNSNWRLTIVDKWS